MRAHPVAQPKRPLALSPFAHIVPLLVVAAALTVILGPVPVEAATSSAFVRVNQMGYATTASKRAYLMASGAETGATFSVKNAGGTTVYSAPVGANLGRWSTGYPNVYALDFSSVSTPGTYTIAASGPIAGSSPSFTIDTAAKVY